MPFHPVRARTELLEPRRLFTTYYVSPTGSDGADGSSDAMAFATLQHAADTVQPGDTVIARPGIYAAGFELPFNQGATQPIQFLADPGAIITGPGTSGPSGSNGLAIAIGYNFPNSVSASMEPVTIEGFTIDGSNGTITNDGVFIMWADGSIVQNNTIMHVGQQGILTKYTSNVLIQGNTAAYCGINNTEGATDGLHGIYVTDSCNHPTIRGNTLYNNLDSGLHLNGDANSGLYPQAGDHSGMISNALIENNVIHDNLLNGMNLDGMQNSVIRNNVMYNNGSKEITIFSQDAANDVSGNQIYNNTLVSTASAHRCILLSSGTTTANNNAIFNNICFQPFQPAGNPPIDVDSTASAGTAEDYNIMSTAALALYTAGAEDHSLAVPNDDLGTVLVNAANNDYHLTSTSIAIDAGIGTLNGAVAPTFDIEGNPRPTSAGFDIGAYELAGVVNVPGAPSNLAATPVDPLSITLSWTETSRNATGFLIERSTDGVNFVQITSVPANLTSYTDTGLTSGTTYTYQIRAMNSAGDSAYSNMASGVGPAAPAVPADPTNLTAAAAGYGKIKLSWSESSTALTGLQIEQSTDGVNFSQIAVVPPTATTYIVALLTPNTAYTFRVRAANYASESGYSNLSSATTQPVGPGPFSLFDGASTPITPDVSDMSSTEVGVRFKSDVLGTITGIRFYKGATNIGTHTGSLWTDAGKSLGDVTFTNETASGWQEADFSQPIFVRPNVYYVASYFAPNGQYAEDDNYFAAGLDSGPLHVPSAGASGFNSAFTQTAVPAFPDQNFSSANYYVDVVFSPSPTSITLLSTTVDDGTAQRSLVRSITLRFDHAVGLIPGAVTLSLLNTGGSGTNDGSAATDASAALGTPASADGGITWVVPILVSTASSNAIGSLNDGIYTVTLHAGSVVDAFANSLSGGDQSITFHRLYGDIDGNGTVNSADYFKFKAAFGSTSGQSNFNLYFDFDGNGKINSSDYFKFKANFGKRFKY
jgi:parallel beta-helix repeat protein